MCNEAVEEDPFSLQYVPDWFVVKKQLNMWYSDCYNDDYDQTINWCDSYKGHRAQKAKIKEDSMFNAWHPSRWWDQCASEDEKKQTKKLWK